MELRNPHPPDVLPKRRRTPFIKERFMTEEELQAEQDEKQRAHGVAVAAKLKADELARRRADQHLRRGVPTVRDEMSEMVNARMDQASIPTRGNTDR